jgi:bifunctional UDP-N-acetylglucosamine pyrophosphorylase/glucosamine-1-phosphate N-acetyltransferase
MRSSRPKPLHLLCGRPMVVHVLDALGEVAVDRVVVVVGHAAERVSKLVQAHAPSAVGIEFVEQRVQRGTGDAVSVALTGFGPEDELEDGDILVLPGDTPLLRPPTLAALVRTHRQSGAAASVLTAVIDDPTGYGRIVRGKDDRVRRIVEHADADADERAINEVNTSIYCFRSSVLAPALRRLTPENAQGEYYLSDVIEVLADAGYSVVSMVAEDAIETAGVNDRAQLAIAEAELRARTNERWMRRGVTMLDPEHTYIDVGVELAADVTLFPGTILRGATVVASGAEIGPYTHLVDTVVGERAVVDTTVARQASIGPDARVGPFASLEPGAVVPGGTVTGPHYRGPDDLPGTG